MKKMMHTGLTFKWESGCRNDAAIKVLESRGINWKCDFGQLKADVFFIGLYFDVEYKPLGNDLFEIVAR